MILRRTMLEEIGLIDKGLYMYLDYVYLLIFFERFVLNGQEKLERVCQFVGSQRQPRWVESLEPTNVSSRRMRGSPLRDAIVNVPALRTIRKRLVLKSCAIRRSASGRSNSVRNFPIRRSNAWKRSSMQTSRGWDAG